MDPKIKLHFIIFMISTLSHQADFGCFENQTKGLIYIPNRGYSSEGILKSTITCTNISYSRDIPFNYTKDYFNQSLKITDSFIPTLPLLSKFSTILSLELSSLHIKDITGAFSGLTNLRKLYLDRNDITQLSKGVFKSLNLLEILDLAHNSIHYIGQQAFVGATELKELHLNGNNISEIGKNTFKAQQRLEFLDLSGNPLENLQEMGLTTINTLLLNETSLRKFDQNLYHLTSNVLNLSSSDLIEINFHSFPALDSVDLSYNSLSVGQDWNILDCQHVNLTHNNVTEIEEIGGMIRYLYLSYNQISSIPGAETKQIKATIALDFSYNLISDINRNAFVGCQHMERLYLQHNKIDRIDVVCFHHLYSLNYLDLSNNRIAHLQYGTFNNLAKVWFLDLSNNALSELYQFTLSSITHLTDLHFDHNRISSFDPDYLLRHLQHLRLISWNNNPWVCKELTLIHQTLQKSHVAVIDGHSFDVENVHGVACSNQDEFEKSLNLSKDLKNFGMDFLKTVNKAVENSKIERLFNEEFKESMFYKYFNQEYARSNFFKYLENYKFAEISKPSTTSMGQTERLASLEVKPSDSYDMKPFLVVLAILQIIIACMVLGIAYLAFNFFKRQSAARRELASQVELL